MIFSAPVLSRPVSAYLADMWRASFSPAPYGLGRQRQSRAGGGSGHIDPDVLELTGTPGYEELDRFVAQGGNDPAHGSEQKSGPQTPAPSAEQQSGQYAQHGKLSEVGQLADEMLGELKGHEALEQGEDPFAL